MKSPRACALQAANLCSEFRLRLFDVVTIQLFLGEVRIQLFPEAFARVAGKLNLKRKYFDVILDADILHVKFRARGAMWTTLVRRIDEDQWKLMHEALRLSSTQKSLPAPVPKRIEFRQLCLPAPKSTQTDSLLSLGECRQQAVGLGERDDSP